MNFYARPRFWIVVAAMAAAIVFLYQLWHWEVERTEVPPGKFLVLIHAWGKDLPEDEIIAPDDSYKGIMLPVLPEGRHFINPILWTTEWQEMVHVKPGQCLVLTRKFGERLPKGEILAEEDPLNPHKGQRGILKDVRLPGSYRINKHAYAWETVPAVEIRADQVGVRTLKVGKEPRAAPDKARGQYVVKKDFRGVQEDYVSPGTYYINPYVESITPVEVRSHLVDLADIEFPSRDGFILKPHVTVEYAVQAKKAPELLVRIAEEGKLHQEDSRAEQDKNEILQKIIFPHIRGYARIEGSKFDAKDFIGTQGAEVQKSNSREKLQKAMEEQVRPKCAELGVNVIAVILSDDMQLPPELKDQISQRDKALAEQAKNKERIGQYKAEQELKAAEGLKQQSNEKVQAETRRKLAMIKAEQKMEVEEARLKQELSNAQTQLEAAREQKKAILEKGKAEAAVIHLQNQAEVAGLQKAIQGFTSVQHFAQYHVLSKIAPALTEIFASDDSDIAKIFATYMNMTPMQTISPKP